MHSKIFKILCISKMFNGFNTDTDTKTDTNTDTDIDTE